MQSHYKKNIWTSGLVVFFLLHCITVSCQSKYIFVQRVNATYSIFTTKTYSNTAGYLEAEEEWRRSQKKLDNSAIAEGNRLRDVGLEMKRVCRFDAALEEFKRSLAYYEKGNCTACIGNIYGLIASVHFNLGNNIQVTNFSQLAEDKFRETGHPLMLATGLRTTAKYYMYFGNNDKAIEYYEKALKIYKEKDQPALLTDTYSDISITYRNKEDLDKAIEVSRTTLNLRLALNDSARIAESYHNIAAIYASFYEYSVPDYRIYLDTAMKLNTLALRYDPDPSTDRRAMMFEARGDIYLRMALYEAALKNYQTAMSIAKERGFPIQYFNGLIKAADASRLLGRISDAKDYLNEAYRAGHETGQIYVVKKIYEKFVDLDTTIGNFADAYKHQRLFTQYQDSIYNVSRIKLISELQAKFDSEKKEIEIARLEEEKRKQNIIKNTLIACLVMAMILSVLIYNNHITKRKLELQMLRNKIASDLHDDIGSTLSSISIFSEVALHTKDPGAMLVAIGESSRKMLDSMADIVWSINPENDHFEKIILRMKNFAYELLGAKKIDFEFDVNDQAAMLKVSMNIRKNLYLIFKEAINNIVKYAGAQKAYFSLTKENEELILLIRDNGKGFCLGQSSRGNGLRNMRKRSAEMGAQLKIESSPGSGTSIHIRIPL